MSDAKDTEDEYLATGFRNVHGAKIEKIMRCLDVLQPIECFQHYKDPSVDLLGGARDLSALKRTGRGVRPWRRRCQAKGKIRTDDGDRCEFGV